VQNGQNFSFTVNSSTIQVPAGSCSQPIRTGVGTAVVAENPAPGFVVSKIEASPPSALVKGDPATGTASVTVSKDLVTNVIFTNIRATGTLKICKAAGTGVVSGQPFTFNVSGQSGSVTAQAGYCSFPIKGIPAGNVTVSENVPSGYQVSAFNTAGAGALVSQDLAGASAVVSIVQGTTILYVTNMTKPSVSGCTYTKDFYGQHSRFVKHLLKAKSGGKLLVGQVYLTVDQIHSIYGRSGTNFLDQVTQQLITALLNQLGGASTPTSVQNAINAAHMLVDASGGPLNGTAAATDVITYNGTTFTAQQLLDALTAYNSGTSSGGPGKCRR
jgi:hypothetical protein